MSSEWEAIAKVYVIERCPDIDEVFFYEDFVSAYSNIDDYAIRVDGIMPPASREMANAVAKIIIDRWITGYRYRISLLVGEKKKQ